MFKVTLLCIISFIGIVLVRISSASEMGPADLLIKRVEECDEPDKYLTPFGILMAKINRTHSGISSCLELGTEMDETVSLNVSVAKWGDGGWKPNQINHFSEYACDTLVNKLTDPWHTFLDAAKVSIKTCSLPKGKYCVDKMIVDMAGTFPSMIYGDLRVDVEILIGEERHRCVRLYLKSDPQKKKPPTT